MNGMIGSLEIRVTKYPRKGLQNAGLCFLSKKVEKCFAASDCKKSHNMVFLYCDFCERVCSMELPRILIADGSEEFRCELSLALRGSYIVISCADGKQALELLESYRPELLVLDLMLPGLDGITLMQRLQNMHMHPAILATTRFVSDYVINAAQQLGAKYMMLHPCDIQGTMERIADLHRLSEHPVSLRPDGRSMVSNMLLALGVPTKLRGYYQLREAVLLMAADPSQSITKQLYPAVAKLCDATAQQVERAARSAIRAAWEHRDERVWRRYFQQDPCGHIPRPSNAEFITRLADAMCISLEKELDA